MDTKARSVFTVWALILLLGLGFIALSVFLRDLGCEHATGDSRYGDYSWGWFPKFGPRCEWTEARHGVADVREPSGLGTVWLAVVIGGYIWLLRARRATP